MLYYYTVYALVECGYCARAISKLAEHGLDHVLVLMDKSPDFHSQIKKRYDHGTVPVIVKSDKTTGDDIEFIGGYDDLIERLREEGFEDAGL